MVLKQYKQAIHHVFETLKSHHALMPTGIERQFILDDENGHYQILDVGWESQKFIHDIMVHIDIKQDFIWLQADNTDYGIAEALLEQGIPKNRIVLGFHAPFKRKFTGFATGQELPA